METPVGRYGACAGDGVARKSFDRHIRLGGKTQSDFGPCGIRRLERLLCDDMEAGPLPMMIPPRLGGGDMDWDFPEGLEMSSLDRLYMVDGMMEKLAEYSLEHDGKLPERGSMEEERAMWSGYVVALQMLLGRVLEHAGYMYSMVYGDVKNFYSASENSIDNCDRIHAFMEMVRHGDESGAEIAVSGKLALR